MYKNLVSLTAWGQCCVLLKLSSDLVIGLILTPFCSLTTLYGWQGAGFNSRTTQHLRRPVMAFLIQPCRVFSFIFAYFFKIKVCIKIKSSNSNLSFAFCTESLMPVPKGEVLKTLKDGFTFAPSFVTIYLCSPPPSSNRTEF